MNKTMDINKGSLLLDPRTKMCLMFIVSIISLTGSEAVPTTYIRLLVMLLPIVLLLTIKNLYKVYCAQVLSWLHGW